jgi:hypothetical protein
MTNPDRNQHAIISTPGNIQCNAVLSITARAFSLQRRVGRTVGFALLRNHGLHRLTRVLFRFRAGIFIHNHLAQAKLPSVRSKISPNGDRHMRGSRTAKLH